MVISSRVDPAGLPVEWSDFSTVISWFTQGDDPQAIERGRQHLARGAGIEPVAHVQVWDRDVIDHRVERPAWLLAGSDQLLVHLLARSKTGELDLDLAPGLLDQLLGDV